jgi:hypothetical protein
VTKTYSVGFNPYVRVIRHLKAGALFKVDGVTQVLGVDYTSVRRRWSPYATGQPDLAPSWDGRSASSMWSSIRRRCVQHVIAGAEHYIVNRSISRPSRTRSNEIDWSPTLVSELVSLEVGRCFLIELVSPIKGTVRMTDADVDKIVSGNTFVKSPGFTVTKWTVANGGRPAGIDLTLPFDDIGPLLADDIKRGAWRGASITCWVARSADPSDREIIVDGFIGRRSLPIASPARSRSRPRPTPWPISSCLRSSRCVRSSSAVQNAASTSRR